MMDEPRFEQLMDDARSTLREGNYVGALAMTDQLVAMAPDDPTVRTLRTEVLLHGDSREEALAEARRAAEAAPRNDRSQTLLGLAAWRASRLTLAQQALEKAIELSDHRPGLLADYAWFMAAERGPRLAEDAALEAVAANDQSSTAWAALGLAQFRLHRRDEAESSLKRALQLDPDDPYAQWAMVRLLQDQRKDASAVALARLLNDTPGTEDLVEAVQQHAKQREIAGKLVERNIFPDAPRGQRPRRPWIWAILAIVLIAGFFVLLQPAAFPNIAFCILMPLFLLWFLHGFFD